MTEPLPRSSTHRPYRDRLSWLLGILVLLVTGAFIEFIADNYYLKVYSDPYHWLTAARDFPGSFVARPLAPGYPAFLAAMAALWGRFGVFLSNAVVLLVLAALVGWLSMLAVRPERNRREALLFGVAGYALLLGYDPFVLNYLVNPYRDPLAFCFLIGSLLCLITSLQSERCSWWKLGTAGLLLGLGVCVRETLVLVLPGLGLYGLWAWYDRRSIGFWKATWAFAFGLLIGMAPLLVQSWLASGPSLQTAYGASRGRALPGLHLVAFPITAPQIVGYYRDATPIWFALLLGSGFGWALWRRSRLVLALLLPAILVNLVFYGFYWTLAARYLFVVHLLLVPIAVLGFLPLLHLLERVSSIRDRVLPTLAVMTVMWCSVILVRVDFEQPRFRISDAKALAAAVQAVVPSGGVILSSRLLCEVLDYCTHASSFSAMPPATREGVLDPARLQGVMNEAFRRNPNVFVAAMHGESGPDRESANIRSGVTLTPRLRFAAAEYGLENVCGDVDIEILEAAPWSKTVATFDVPDSAEDAILQLDLGPAWSGAPERTELRLDGGGETLVSRLNDGVNYVALESPNPRMVTLFSDQPVPDRPRMQWVPRGQPIFMDLRAEAVPRHDRFLSPSLLSAQTDAEGVRIVADQATIRLPTPYPQGALVQASLRLRSTYRGRPQADGTLDTTLVELTSRGESLASVPVIKDRYYRPVEFQLEAAPGEATVPFRLQVDANSLLPTVPAAGYPDGLYIDAVEFWQTPNRPSVAVDIGAASDGIYLVSGWYSGERSVGNRTVRWTRGTGVLRLGLIPGQADYRLLVDTVGGHRPASAPAVEPSLLFNGHSVKVTDVDTGKGQLVRIEAVIPNRHMRPGVNELVVGSNTWVPAEHGELNQNRLGLLVDRIECRPVPASGSR